MWFDILNNTKILAIVLIVIIVVTIVSFMFSLWALIASKKNVRREEYVTATTVLRNDIDAINRAIDIPWEDGEEIDIGDALNYLKVKTSANSDAIDDLDTRVEAIDVSSLDSKIDANTTSIGTLRTDMDTKIAAVNTRADNLQTSIDDLATKDSFDVIRANKIIINAAEVPSEP